MPSGIAIFELQVTITNRTNPETERTRSAVSAAAYRAGEKLYDQKIEKTYDFSRRTDVEHSEILAPDNAPEWVYDRSELWNQHEAKEIRSDAQIYREVRVGLPKAFNTAENIDMTRSWVKEHFTSRGMVADISFHDMEQESSNPHAHIMLTMRHLEADGFGNKNREWNNYSPVLKLSKEFRDENDIDFTSQVEKWRVSWSIHVNAHLEQSGIDAQISHLSKAEAKRLEEKEALAQMNAEIANWWQAKHSKSLEAQHLPLAAYHMEQRGIETRAGEWLDGVEIRNAAREQATRHEQQLNKHFEVKNSHDFTEKIADYWQDFNKGIAHEWEDEYSQFVEDLEHG